MVPGLSRFYLTYYTWYTMYVNIFVEKRFRGADDCRSGDTDPLEPLFFLCVRVLTQTNTVGENLLYQPLADCLITSHSR